MKQIGFTSIVIALLFWSATAIQTARAQSNAGNLIVDSQNHGNGTYGDWAGADFVWGAGYPLVDVAVDTDETLIFPGGVQRQRMFDMHLVSASSQLDNPMFRDTYSGDLFASGLICDSGTMRITYAFEFATQLADIMLLDLDENDVAQIEIFGEGGQQLDPTYLELVSEGDLSRYANAPGQPPTQLATPPHWDPTRGTLTAVVAWNENRSFSVLRPRVPITKVRVSATGIRSAPDPSSAGSHIYTSLWATPRAFEITEIRSVDSSQVEITWASLPGLSYRILGSPDSVFWSDETTVEGFPPPATHSTVALPIGVGSRFFRIGHETANNAIGPVSVAPSDLAGEIGASGFKRPTH